MKSCERSFLSVDFKEGARNARNLSNPEGCIQGVGYALILESADIDGIIDVFPSKTLWQFEGKIIPSSKLCFAENKYKAFVQCYGIFFVFINNKIPLKQNYYLRIFKRCHLLQGCVNLKNNLSFIARKLGSFNKLSDVSEVPTYIELTLYCLYVQEVEASKYPAALFSFQRLFFHVVCDVVPLL